MRIFSTSLNILLTAGMIALFSCSDDPDVDTLTRNTDQLDFGYKESTQEFTVRVSGPWNAETSAGWLDLEPAEGTGNGRDYQYVTVTASHNPGEERSAVIYLSSGSETLEITANQAAGIFGLGSPTLSGSLKMDISSSAYISIPYSKATGTEEIKVTVTVGGHAAAGVEVPDYTESIAETGDGYILAPIEGTPQVMGAIEFVVTVSVNGRETLTATIEDEVLEASIVLAMTGRKFKWGGDYMTVSEGIRSNRGSDISVDDDNPENYDMYMEVIPNGTDGTVDLFTVEKFRTDRGLGGWKGSKVYERPGYLKIGTGANGGYLQTPALVDIQGTATLTVQFDYCRWENETGDFRIVAEGGGNVIGGTLPGDYAPLRANAEWRTLSYTVESATAATSIKWEALDQNNGGSRVMIRNIFIFQAKELYEPLPAPENVTATAADESIAFEWDPVEDATGYFVELCRSDTPNFISSATTTDTEYVYSDLTPDTSYDFTVTAVYSPNTAMNSARSEKLTISTVFVLPALSTPTVTLLDATRGLLSFDWTFDGSQTTDRKFNIRLTDMSGNILRNYENVSFVSKYKYNRFSFGKLDAVTSYICEVQRVSPDPYTYRDSDWAQCTGTTVNPVMPAGEVLYYDDFDDMWMGGNGINVAWSAFPTAFGASLGSYNVAGDNFTAPYTIAEPHKNMTDVFGASTANLLYRQTYWANYMDWGSWTAPDSKNTKIYPCCGLLKFGTGGQDVNGIMTLPAFPQLTQGSTITLRFKAHPYTEPNNSTGDLENASLCVGTEVKVSVAEGTGTIASNGGTTITLTNKTPVETSANGAGRYIWTDHEVTIQNAGPQTRLSIATTTGATQQRMWLDDLIVTKN